MDETAAARRWSKKILFESLDRLVYSTQVRGRIPREFRRFHTMSEPHPKAPLLLLALPPASAQSTPIRLAKRGTISFSLLAARRSSLKLR
jgi:hypothetical protein